MSSTKSNAYFCVTCGGMATKPACKRSPGEKAPDKATLGTWSCAKCGRAVKVRRESQAQKAAA